MQSHELSAKPTLAGRWLVPLLILGFICYTWYSLLTTELNPLWRHWTALVCIIPVIFMCWKNSRLGVLLTAIYLVVAIFAVFALLPSLTRFTLSVGPLPIPLGQPIAWPFFILHLCLNFNCIVDLYLDWKQAKAAD